MGQITAIVRPLAFPSGLLLKITIRIPKIMGAIEKTVVIFRKTFFVFISLLFPKFNFLPKCWLTLVCYSVVIISQIQCNFNDSGGFNFFRLFENFQLFSLTNRDIWVIIKYRDL